MLHVHIPLETIKFSPEYPTIYPIMSCSKSLDYYLEFCRFILVVTPHCKWIQSKRILSFFCIAIDDP